MAGPWEATAPQLPSHSGYMMVSVFQKWQGMTIRLFCHHMKPIVQNDNLGQGGPIYAQPGYDFAANQPHGQTSFSPLLPGPLAAPSNQGAFPVWCLFNSWVNYAAEDELHVTIVFRRIPSA
jgi:hypothetical protein